MNTLKTVLFTSAFLSAAACGKQENNSELNTIVEKRGDDVTVLQAWLGDSVGLKLNAYFGEIDPSQCHETSRNSSNHNGTPYYYVETDCKSAIEEKMKLNGHSQVSPLINAARHAYYDYPDQGKYTITGRCEIVEFRTITPDETLNSPAFKGIGFYFSRSESELIGKERLHKVGSVVLKNGRPATVHRFIAQGMCFGTGGNGGTISDRQYKFRPLAQFDGFDGNLYNVWDNVATDYLLGRNREIYTSYVFVRNFDRQDELLQK